MVARPRRHAALRAQGRCRRPVDPQGQARRRRDAAIRKLVLATGSRPIRLHVPGMELPGVLTFRDLGDVGAIEAAAAGRAKAVVIGGGLLGLEAAYGLAKAGAQVTVVHLMDRLMERQLDAARPHMLKRAVEARGIEVHLDAETRENCGTSACAGRRAEGRPHIRSRPRGDGGRHRDRTPISRAPPASPSIAASSSMTHLQTSTPGIHAIGECAEHRGACYGLVEPAYEQASVLAARLAGDDMRVPGSVLATNLKVSGVNVFSAGDFLGAPGTEAIVLSDAGLATYKKLVIANGRLIGAVLFGDTADGALVSRSDPVRCSRSKRCATT